MNHYPPRPVDGYFEQYAESYQHPAHKSIHLFFVPLILFSLLGLVWVIPFPRFDMLGRLNGYINWATFLIFFSLLYYLRLSFLLALGMLVSICVGSAGIIALEKIETRGGPALWQVCLLLFMLSWMGQFIGHRIGGKKASFLVELRLLLIAPIWLWLFVFRKLGIKY